MLDATNLPISLQALSPKTARFCLGLERFLLHELWPQNDTKKPKSLNEQETLKHNPLQGKKICVALSGGADSMALLLAFFYLQKRLGIALQAVHLHHGLRLEADEEAKAVVRFCTQLGIECTVHHVPVKDEAEQQKIGVEEAGRLARYALFASLVKQSETWVALGHHADDLCEDVILRLIRGAGWPALGGMTGLDVKRKIMRPLLCVRRTEIENFLKDLGVSWVNDASNTSLDYRRNRIRHQVIPLLREENPVLHETMLSLWKLARIDENFWDERLYSTTKSTLQSRVLERTLLRTLPKAERLRLYKMMLDDLGAGQANVTTLLALDDAWEHGRGGVVFQFSGHKSAHIQRGKITFTLAPPAK